MKNESIFEHLKGAKPVAPNVLAKLEEGMKKIVEQSRKKISKEIKLLTLREVG